MIVLSTKTQQQRHPFPMSVTNAKTHSTELRRNSSSDILHKYLFLKFFRIWCRLPNMLAAAISRHGELMRWSDLGAVPRHDIEVTLQTFVYYHK